jgi:hypothetical protein
MTLPDKTASETKPRGKKSRIAAIVVAISAPIIWFGGLMSPIVDFDEFMVKVGLRKPSIDKVKADEFLETLDELNKQHEEYEQKNPSIEEN